MEVQILNQSKNKIWGLSAVIEGYKDECITFRIDLEIHILITVYDFYMITIFYFDFINLSVLILNYDIDTDYLFFILHKHAGRLSVQLCPSAYLSISLSSVCPSVLPSICQYFLCCTLSMDIAELGYFCQYQYYVESMGY